MSTQAIVQQWERELLEKGALRRTRDVLVRMSPQAIVQQWERELLEKGAATGALKKTRDVLMRQLRTRFGELDAATEGRIAKATVDELNRWTERVIVAERIDDVFKA